MHSTMLEDPQDKQMTQDAHLLALKHASVSDPQSAMLRPSTLDRTKFTVAESLRVS